MTKERSLCKSFWKNGVFKWSQLQRSNQKEQVEDFRNCKEKENFNKLRCGNPNWPTNVFQTKCNTTQHRDVDVKKVLKYELSAFLLSDAYSDGSLCNTVQSKLQSVLEYTHLSSLIWFTQHMPIFDAMAFLPKFSPGFETFGDLSSYLLKKILSGIIRIVFVVYSIKSMERKKRSNAGSIRVNVSRRSSFTFK